MFSLRAWLCNIDTSLPQQQTDFSSVSSSAQAVACNDYLKQLHATMRSMWL